MGIIVASFCITYVHMGVMEPSVDMTLETWKGSPDEKWLILKARLSFLCQQKTHTNQIFCAAILD